MNNIMSGGGAIFVGQKLRVRRKQRSQSLPVLPFADRMDHQANDDDDTDERRRDREHHEQHRDEEQPHETSLDRYF